MTVKLPVSLIAEQVEGMCKLCIFPNVSQVERDLVMAYMTQLRQHVGDINVNCRFETIESRQLTRLVVEISPRDIRPWRVRR